MSDSLMKKQSAIVVLTVLPLMIGGLIYLLWRPETLLMFVWADHLGVIDLVMLARVHAELYYLPNWALYNLPNGTWAYAFTATMTYLWVETYGPKKLLYILMPFFLGVFFEIGQYLNVIPGTFCLGDIVAHLLGATLGYLLINLAQRRVVDVL